MRVEARRRDTQEAVSPEERAGFALIRALVSKDVDPSKLVEAFGNYELFVFSRPDGKMHLGLLAQLAQACLNFANPSSKKDAAFIYFGDRLTVYRKGDSGSSVPSRELTSPRRPRLLE